MSLLCGNWERLGRGSSFPNVCNKRVRAKSLGFSPSEILFGHTVRGPLKLLSEQLLDQSSKPVPVDDYVTSIRERLHKAQILT